MTDQSKWFSEPIFVKKRCIEAASLVPTFTRWVIRLSPAQGVPGDERRRAETSKDAHPVLAPLRNSDLGHLGGLEVGGKRDHGGRVAIVKWWWSRREVSQGESCPPVISTYGESRARRKEKTPLSTGPSNLSAQCSNASKAQCSLLLGGQRRADGSAGERENLSRRANGCPKPEAEVLNSSVRSTTHKWVRVGKSHCSANGTAQCWHSLASKDWAVRSGGRVWLGQG